MDCHLLSPSADQSSATPELRHLIPNTFNVLSGNNVNMQFSAFGNVAGGQSSNTGNNNSNSNGNTTNISSIHF